MIKYDSLKDGKNSVKPLMPVFCSNKVEKSDKEMNEHVDRQIRGITEGGIQPRTALVYLKLPRHLHKSVYDNTQTNRQR